MNPNIDITVDPDGTIVLEIYPIGGSRSWMTREEARDLASRLQNAAVESGLR